MSLVSEFFSDIDRRWELPHTGKIRLRVIGSSALMLQTNYSRGTKDGDVVETSLITSEVKQHLLALAPKDVESVTFKKYRMYIDVVPPGLLFLPQVPLCHPLTDLNATLGHLEFEVLDVLDVVVSKLKRFNSSDRSDINAMVDRNLVDINRLVDRFRAAVDFFAMDSRAEDLPRVIKNLNYVQEEMLVTAPTEIELPNWLL